MEKEIDMQFEESIQFGLEEFQKRMDDLRSPSSNSLSQILLPILNQNQHSSQQHHLPQTNPLLDWQHQMQLRAEPQANIPAPKKPSEVINQARRSFHYYAGRKILNLLQKRPEIVFIRPRASHITSMKQNVNLLIRLWKANFPITTESQIQTRTRVFGDIGIAIMKGRQEYFQSSKHKNIVDPQEIGDQFQRLLKAAEEIFVYGNIQQGCIEAWDIGKKGSQISLKLKKQMNNLTEQFRSLGWNEQFSKLNSFCLTMKNIATQRRRILRRNRQIREEADQMIMEEEE